MSDSKDTVQTQMLIELRKIAAQRGGTRESGGYFYNFYVGVKGLTSAQQALKVDILQEKKLKEGLITTEAKRAKSTGTAMKSMAGGMAQQALLMNPLNALLGGFLDVFEPIADAFGAIGDVLGTSLGPIINDLAQFILGCLPAISEFAKWVAAAWEGLKNFATGLWDFLGNLAGLGPVGGQGGQQFAPTGWSVDEQGNMNQWW